MNNILKATSTRMIPALLSLALVFAIVAPARAWADHGDISSLADASWYDKAKSEYTLTSNSQMEGLAQIINSGADDFKGKVVKLGANLINLTIPPIGTESRPFAGIFDGDGHTITNLTLSPVPKTYAGLFGRTAAGSAIKNLGIEGGELSIAENNASGSQVRYVGALVGYAGGNIENCSSSMDVSVSSKLALGKHQGIIRNVGGLAGYISGDMKDCSHSGDMMIASSSDINADVRFLIGEVGGLSGAQGDVTDCSKLPVTEDCTNYGDFIFDIAGSGGVDRFGERLYAVSFAVGGIVGQASGIVRGCTNRGIINTSNGSVAKPESGRGANRTGGIVGDLRGNTFEQNNEALVTNVSEKDPGFIHFKNNGGAANAPSSYPQKAGVYDCANTGVVVGLAMVGGIVGNAGTFTEIEGCSNTGDVKGCRWNKPFTGGIGGAVQGDIRYCFSRGDIYSVTGGGYFCAGIAGGLWSLNTSSTPDNDIVPVNEMTGCYVSGIIYTSAAGYRTGFLAGENDGYIHDNVYSAYSQDDKVIDSDRGTAANNSKLTIADLKAGKGIGLLNAYAAGAGGWRIFYLPDLNNINGGYPALSREFNTSGTDINVRAATVMRGAIYSVAIDPVPLIEIEGLVQNADFYVVPQGQTKGVSPGGTDYHARVYGMGRYSGQLAATVPYKIIKAGISDCTIVAASATFNWGVQAPHWVKVIDASGSEVNPSEYSWRTLYDQSKGTIPVQSGGSYHYYDYTYSHGDVYKYDIEVTATSNRYEGTAIQAAFRILPKSLASTDDSGTGDASVRYGAVTWGGREWDFKTALNDTSGNHVKIAYTGQPIKPTVKSITYLNRELRLAPSDWYKSPYDYDYLYIYGNPNPVESNQSSVYPIDVTPQDKPACMTVRYLSSSSFRNYINVFFQIVPASIANVTAKPIGDKVYTGRSIEPEVKLTYNGVTLKKGTDYSLAYRDNRIPGKATITVTGKGNYTGVKTLYFKISPAKQKAPTLAPGAGKLTVKFKRPSSAQKATGFELRYRAKDEIKWKKMILSVKKSKYSIKKLKKGKRYQVQMRIVRKIKTGYAKGSYYGAWSAVKTSKAIK
ncbi:MAG: fibronectin type III domain-containing protein [Clostridiales Family XIII bacterium]|jgi:hypothetical protein|nr:fibronectin type III domain-containing protein [Clostridiales Family XIII bacterium]